MIGSKNNDEKETKIDTMTIFKSVFPVIIALCLFSAKESKKQTYKCLPCGLACDTISFSKPGTCTICSMELVRSNTITFKNIEPNAICYYMTTHPEAILLDVRTREEFEGMAEPNFGSLKNAINIPIQELKTRLTELSLYKNKEIIVYCSHSHRSPQAAYLLTQNGFKQVANMSGGMSEVTDKSCNR